MKLKQNLSNEQIVKLFQNGIDCSQIIVDEKKDALGITKEDALKMSAAFGGGMGIGETCGAVIGAMIVLGLKYGNTDKNQPEKKELLNAKRAEFLERFSKFYPSCVCKKLLGYDFSKPEEVAKIFEKNLLFEFCPNVVKTTLDILEDMKI